MGRDRLAPAHKTLYYWGVVNLFFALGQQFLNYILSPIGANKFTYSSILVWLVVAVVSKRATLRFPLFLVIMLVLAVWFNITTLYAETQVARFTIFTAMDTMLYVYALAFLQAAALVWFAPEVRRVYGRVMVVIVVLSSVVALTQFLNFQPTIAYANMVRQFDIVFTTGEREETIRSPGLFSNIGTAAVYGMIVSIMVTTALEFRKMKWYEYTAVAFMMLSTLLVQVRTLLPFILICAVYLLVRFMRLYGAKGLGVVVLGITAVLGFVAYKADSFEYLFSSSNATMAYRKEVLWTQAYQILDEYPLTGIGIEPAFAGWTTQILPNKWVETPLIDSGFWIAGCYGGWPAIGLIIMCLIAALLGAIRLLRAPDEDGWHRAFKLGVLWLVILFTVAMYWGSQWVNPAICTVYFVFAGLSLPSARSEGIDPERQAKQTAALGERLWRALPGTMTETGDVKAINKIYK
ncbi:MAG: hypothetical protein JNM85_03170 [Chthonomonas sp.]|nr:hypothetical protein [Chthonomonas sp.]